MKGLNLEMLKGITLAEVQAPAKGGSSGPRVVKEPVEGAQLRVFKNGRVYSSPGFAASFSLEYQAKLEEVDTITGDVSTTVVGAGLDIFSSEGWKMAEELNLPQTLLFVAITPRQGNGKIDVFGSVQYNEDGSPKKTLLEGGPITFGKEILVPLLESVYEVNFEETPFVDLIVNTDYPMVSPNDVYILPKVVARGEKKGQASYVRRETIDIFPLTVLVPEAVVAEDNGGSDEAVVGTAKTSTDDLFEDNQSPGNAVETKPEETPFATAPEMAGVSEEAQNILDANL